MLQSLFYYVFVDSVFDNTGHYTQVAWADTYAVGCGMVSYKIVDKFAYQRIYFCNYGPGGNYVGSAMQAKASDGLCA